MPKSRTTIRIPSISLDHSYLSDYYYTPVRNTQGKLGLRDGGTSWENGGVQEKEGGRWEGDVKQGYGVVAFMFVYTAYCGRVRSTCLGTGRWKVAGGEAGGKKAGGKR